MKDYYWINRKKAVNMVIMLYFKRQKTCPNTSHIIQPPHLLHISIWNAAISGCGYRKIIQKLLVKRWLTPCLMEYYKPPNRKRRPRSFLDKEEQISHRQMDMEISSRRKGLVEKSYKGEIYLYIKQKSTPSILYNWTCHRVGDGGSTSFWTDPWIENTMLALWYPLFLQVLL